MALNHLMLQYCYLQALDFLTTLAFLMSGVKEGNPLVRAALNLGSTPVSGLLFVKVAAVMLGIWCWRLGRHRLLGRVNVLFAALIVWNLVALVLGRFGA
jgi:hypothetical protein